nr:glucose-6-phosphate dehydrogenase [Acidimicrobium ferrooxidans]
MDVFVIFGVSGDLARKMTFPSLYRLEERGALDFPIVGVALDDWSTGDLETRMRESVSSQIADAKPSVVDRLGRRLRYVRGDFTSRDTVDALRSAVGRVHQALVYLEIPPALFAPVIENLQREPIASEVTYLIEKPFGHDLASAQALNERLHRVVDEQSILRIDHFLGKQPLADLVHLRFANEVLEPLWRREHVEEIQVTMAEDFGVEDRGSFYDPVGALRDVVVNHLLQLLALVLMEPPSRPGADGLWDARVAVLREMDLIEPSRVVRGQYEGYRSIPGVGADSTTETFIALALGVHSWRWDGVPVVVRAGKALPVTATEVRLVLRRPPRLGALGLPEHLEANEIILRIDPDSALRVTLQSLDAEERHLAPVHLDLSFRAELGRSPEPYEVLFLAALEGDRARFAREDVVEEAWRIVDPILAHPNPVVPYRRGSWGPDGVVALTRGHRGFRDPWLGA